MRKIADCSLVLIVLFLSLICLCSAKRQDESTLTPRKYKLVWEDSFDKGKLDESRWSKIDRVKEAEWQKYMSHNEKLFQFKNGYLRLYAMLNNGLEPNDTAQFLTAGISTRHKATLRYGKIEVRARIHGAQGCWPAIWTKADDVKLWKYPERPELDIMEHYNHDGNVVQTIHSNYTDKLGHSKEPASDCKSAIKKNKYNVYAAEILPDRIIYSVNGQETLTYSRLDNIDKSQWQYPFTVDQFLMIDMQVGNKYLKVDKTTFPAYMDIDWVRVYKLEE